MTLMKSTLLTGEPVVLSRPKRWESEPAPIVEPLAMASIDVASLGRGVVAADSEPAPIVPVETISYDEYRERFDAELVALERQAQRQGFEKGEAEGREQALAEYTGQIDALAAVVASARAALEQKIDGVSELSIEVVCEAVTKIIGDALIDRDVVVSAIRQVVREARERSKLVVHVSPHDWTLLEGHRDRLTEGLSVGSVEIVADDRVQLGGCLLETPAGNLDGRLEVQLERLRDALIAAKSAPLVEEEAVA